MALLIFHGDSMGGFSAILVRPASASALTAWASSSVSTPFLSRRFNRGSEEVAHKPVVGPATTTSNSSQTEVAFSPNAFRGFLILVWTASRGAAREGSRAASAHGNSPA